MNVAQPSSSALESYACCYDRPVAETLPTKLKPQLCLLALPSDSYPSWESLSETIEALTEEDLDLGLQMVGLDTHLDDPPLVVVKRLLQQEARLLRDWLESGAIESLELATPRRQETVQVWLVGGMSDGYFCCGRVEAISLLERAGALQAAGFTVITHNADGIS